MKFFLFIISCFFCTAHLQAQCSPETTLIFSKTCEEANTNCKINGYCTDMEPGAWGNDISFCAQGFTLQNPHWYSFIPQTNFIDIKVLVSNCQGGNSTVQWGLFDSCDNLSNAILCNGNGLPSGNIAEVFYANATPGRQYYLVFDGSSGSTCRLEFEVLAGTEISNVGELINNNLTGDTVVCPDITGVYGFEGFRNATSYKWSVDSVELGTSDDPLITINFPPLEDGDYELCVLATNDCDSVGKSICWPIHFNSNITLHEVLYTCQGDSILYQNEFYKTGHYEIPYFGFNPCIDKVDLTVIPFGIPADTIYELIVCGDIEEYNYNGINYKVDSIYENVSFNVSDCEFESNLLITGLDNDFQIISDKDSIGCTGLDQARLQFSGTFLPNVLTHEIKWYDADNQEIGSGNYTDVIYPGNYYCIVDQLISNTTDIFPLEPEIICSERIDFTLYDTFFDIPVPDMQQIAATPSQGKYILEIINFGSYPVNTLVNWLVPDGIGYSALTNQITLNFTSNGVYEICAVVSNNCFQTDTVCFTVIVDKLSGTTTADAPFNFIIKNNPVKDILSFKGSNLNPTSFDLTIMDIQGNTLKNFNHTRSMNEMNFNLTDLQPGFYIYVINTISGKQSGKFIKF